MSKESTHSHLQTNSPIKWFVKACQTNNLLHVIENTLSSGNPISKDEWKQVVKDSLQNRECAIIFIERQCYKNLGYSSIHPKMDIWWLVAFQFPESLFACKLMVKFKLGMEPLQNNLYHKEGSGATKTCKLCMCDIEDAKHFLFTCPILDLPRKTLCTVTSSIYGINYNVMASQDVEALVNPPTECETNKLANLANSVYQMMGVRTSHLPKD